MDQYEAKLWGMAPTPDREPTLRELAHEIHRINVDKGWRVDGVAPNDRTLGNELINIVSEITEASEELRNGHEAHEIYEYDGKPEGFPIEMADAVIRIIDTCYARGIDLYAAIQMKMAYNRTRPYRHGGKKY
jgi:hypothetical protein